MNQIGAKTWIGWMLGVLIWIALGASAKAQVIYCTARITSCGSIPTIGGTGAAASISSASYKLSNGPVPASPAGGPGILIHTAAGPNLSPPLYPYGFLCIAQPFFRTSPAVPGGTPGACNGQYTWNFGLYLAINAGSMGLTAGNTCDIQAWCRDAANAANPPFGAANFSNAMQVVLVP